VTEGMFGEFNLADKMKKAKSVSSLKKIDPKATRGSYIDDI